jgi:hypothetical protein
VLLSTCAVTQAAGGASRLLQGAFDPLAEHTPSVGLRHPAVKRPVLRLLWITRGAEMPRNLGGAGTTGGGSYTKVNRTAPSVEPSILHVLAGWLSDQTFRDKSPAFAGKEGPRCS